MKLKDTPEGSPAVPLSELQVAKPVINSVSFHRYGKEFAITVTGDKLWFCNKVKVGLCTQELNAEDSSQKLLQFNRSREDIASIPSTSDYVSVRIWSHFFGPVSNDKVKVQRKVMYLT